MERNFTGRVICALRSLLCPIPDGRPRVVAHSRVLNGNSLGDHVVCNNIVYLMYIYKPPPRGVALPIRPTYFGLLY